MKERFKATNPKALAATFIAPMGGQSLHREQYLNNISRITLAVLAGALGGCQFIDTRAYDEQFGIPTTEALIQSIRCQQVVAYETGVTDTVDPLGGSYFVESLTNQLEERIVTLLEKIDQMGGIVKAVESGWIHREISNSAYEYQQAIESGEMPIVGMNCYQIENEKLPIELFEVPETLRIQEEKLERIRKERKALEAQRALEAVARCCEEDKNLMEVIVEAVKAYVTEGEISQTLRRSYGTWDPPLF